MLSRLSIRARITLVFAAAMTVLLGALGLFVYLSFRSELDETLDRGLRSRATDIATQLQRSDDPPREVAGRVLVQQAESTAQLLTPDGRVYATTARLGRVPLLGAGETGFVERGGVPGLEDRARLFARRVEAHQIPLVVVVGSSLDPREDSLR